MFNALQIDGPPPLDDKREPAFNRSIRSTRQRRSWRRSNAYQADDCLRRHQNLLRAVDRSLLLYKSAFKSIPGVQAAYGFGLQVSERARAVGRLHTTRGRVVPMRPLGAPAAATDTRCWWTACEPTEESRCGSSALLPLCWGGCPKYHLERDAQALQEQWGYWRRNLARYVLSPWADIGTLTDETLVELGDVAQFRHGTSATHETRTGGCKCLANKNR